MSGERVRAQRPYWTRVRFMLRCEFGCQVGRGTWVRFGRPWRGKRPVLCRQCAWTLYGLQPPDEPEDIARDTRALQLPAGDR